MNAQQEAKLAMNRTVEEFLNGFLLIIAAVPALQNAFNTFKANIAQIVNTAQLKDAPLAGITADKSTFKQTLCQLAADTAGPVFAYATITGNNTLKEAVNFNLTKLVRTRDEQLAARCQNIHDRANENLAALADYGITAAKLTVLQTAIDNYAAQTPKPRTAATQRKVHNANLRQQFKQTDDLLKNVLDKLIVGFRTTNPDFVNGYFANRVIVDASTTNTQLKGTVTDKTTSEPIKDAVITVVELSKITKSNAQGNYNHKPISHGTYTITVSKTGYETVQIDDFQLKLGQITVLDVELEKS